MFNQLVYFNQSEHICSETISGHFRQFYHFVRPIKPGQTISASNHFVWLHHFDEIEQIGPFCLVIPFKLLGPFFVVRSVSTNFILYGKTILSGLFYLLDNLQLFFLAVTPAFTFFFILCVHLFFHRFFQNVIYIGDITRDIRYGKSRLKFGQDLKASRYLPRLDLARIRLAINDVSYFNIHVVILSSLVQALENFQRGRLKEAMGRSSLSRCLRIVECSALPHSQCKWR